MDADKTDVCTYLLCLIEVLRVWTLSVYMLDRHIFVQILLCLRFKV